MLQHDRSRSVEARTLAALEFLDGHARHPFIAIKDIAARVNEDEVEALISARDVGRVLRARCLPVYKSNGRVGVPKSALRAMAIPRKTSPAGPQAAPLDRTAPGEGSRP